MTFKQIKSNLNLQVREMTSSGGTRQFEDVAHSQSYALYRPQPPISLIDHIMKYMENKTSPNLALDIGCGSGRDRAKISGFETRPKFKTSIKGLM